MISYKTWKTLNESVLGGLTNLGISHPTNLGFVSNIPTQEEFIAEAKRKLRKKMGVDDGEIVPPTAKKDANQDADAEAEVDSEEGEEDVEKGEGEEEEGEGELKKGKGEVKKGDKEEEEGDEDSIEPKDDAGSAREMMMKKKMKKDGKKEDDKEDKKEDKKDEKKEDKECSKCKKHPCVCKEKGEKKKDKKDEKECSKCKKCPCVCKKEVKKEDVDWWKSVSNQMGTDSINHKNWDGIGKEPK